MLAVPVSAESLHAREIDGWSVAQQNVALDAARSYAANTVFYRSEGIREVEYLAEPAMLEAFDFHTARDANAHCSVTYEITHAGTCHGWVGWFAIQLGDQWLATSPRDERLHWSPAFLPLDPPLRFDRRDEVTFKLDRNPLGDWTWRVDSPRGRRQHSTLLSTPMSPETLEKAALGYSPLLNVDGQALAYILSQCNGQTSVQAIGRELRSRYPERYHSESDAVRFVQRIIKHYA